VGDREAVKKMLRGHAAAAEMKKRILVAEGPRAETSVADALELMALVDQLHGWPGERSTLEERGIEEVRQRWAKIQRHYRAKARAGRPASRRSYALEARSRTR
jgi:hypothetical protein